MRVFFLLGVGVGHKEFRITRPKDTWYDMISRIFLLFIFHFLMEFLWKLFFILKKQFVKFIYVFDFTNLFWPAHCDFDCLFWKLMITSHIRREFLKDICTYIWLPWLLVLLQIYDEIKFFCSVWLSKFSSQCSIWFCLRVIF